jgi:hypothetical protein
MAVSSSTCDADHLLDCPDEELVVTKRELGGADPCGRLYRGSKSWGCYMSRGAK